MTPPTKEWNRAYTQGEVDRLNGTPLRIYGDPALQAAYRRGWNAASNGRHQRAAP